jgi:hypothetical protein
MRAAKYLTLALALALALLAALAAPAPAHSHGGRQYYGSWSYYPQRSYYYRSYYYQPAAGDDYSYHYCIYYPSQPRYVYYYNPSSGNYWGRLDLEAKGDDKYSLLAKDDQKPTLKEIPEEKFPKPGKMPGIPGAKDNVQIEPPPNDLPK